MKTVNQFFIFLLALICIPALFSDRAYSQNSLTEEERSYLAEKGTILFISQTEYPPFEFKESHGEHTGMCIELARWMATELGFKAKFTDTSFKQAQQDVLSGKADVLTSLFYSKKRDRLFEFTDTIFKVPASIFVAADRPDIKSIEDLNGKIIAMQKGDYALEFLESEHISFQVEYTRNFAEAADRVIEGSADAIIGDEQIVLYHIYSQNLLEKIKIVGKPLYIGQNCMAVKEGNRILRSILNKGVTMARQNGVLDAIRRKWLGIHLSSWESVYSRFLIFGLWIATAVFGIFLFIWLWNVRLRKQVAMRTRDLARSEKILRDSEKFLNTVVENIPNMIFVKDAEHLKFIQFNKAGEELLGYSRNDLIGKSDYDFFPVQEADFFTEKDREVLRSGSLVDIPEEAIHTKNGEKRILHTKKLPVLDKDGNPKYLLGISEDITERLAAEKAKKLSDERLSAAIEAIDEGFAIFDAEDRLAMHNRKYRYIFGDVAHVLVIGKRFDDMLDEAKREGYLDNEDSRSAEWIEKRRAVHRMANGSIEYKLKNGRWIRSSERKTKDGGTVGFHVDITDIKQSEEHMQMALKEKETLLREIHHRVKNNMQVVLSLLSLQSSKVKDERITEAFLEAQSRVQSMALVHEVLYQSDNLTKIDFQTYLKKLTTHIFQAFTKRAGQVKLHIESAGLSIGIDQAVPCGLIVTELLTNSLKYAFPDGPGEIRIDAFQMNPDTIQMCILDNGIGLPPDFDPSSANTLGLRLVIELIEDQLEGTWKTEGKGGTQWIIQWPEKE